MPSTIEWFYTTTVCSEKEIISQEMEFLMGICRFEEHPVPRTNSQHYPEIGTMLLSLLFNNKLYKL
jgi:hypothetical protein